MAFQAFDLNGKVVLVTGGNGGIGLAMAEAVAAAGARVCIWGTSAAKNAAALERLQAIAAQAHALTCDVGDEDAVESAFGETLAEFGRVDACFANAGVSGARSAPFIDMPAHEWRRIMRVNLDGAFHTLRAASRHMVARAESGDPGGRLIGTASLAALSGPARNEHYAATKGGLISMMQGLAVELARYGITANAILPGWIETAMTEDAFAWEKFASNVMPRIPMRRWGRPEDFAGIAVYLTSDASAYHTADSFLIDGGYWRF